MKRRIDRFCATSFYGAINNGKFKGKPEEKDNPLRLEAGSMRFVPRAYLVDLEPGIMEVIKASPMGALFKPDNMFFATSRASNN